MLWAAFCLAFFGFMHSGEFTSPLSHDLDACTLSVADVAIDSRHNRRILTVVIRRSKTDQARIGTNLYLGRTGTTLCPVSAVLAYLAIRPPTPGPLFVFQDGNPLTRDKLVSQMRDALSQLGIDSTNFSGHSFRIGAATTAAKVGFEDSFIQSLGRWKSNAFTAYITSSPDDLAATSAILSPVNL